MYSTAPIALVKLRESSPKSLPVCGYAGLLLKAIKRSGSPPKPSTLQLTAHSDHRNSADSEKIEIINKTLQHNK